MATMSRVVGHVVKAVVVVIVGIFIARFVSSLREYKTAGPCSDFHEFACSRRSEKSSSFDLSNVNNIVLMAETFRSNTYFSNASLPMKQAKIAYDKCVAMSATEAQLYARSKKKLDNVLRDTGASFPMLFQQGKYVDSPLSPNALALLLGHLIGTKEEMSIIKMGVGTDWKNPNKAAITIDQPAVMYKDAVYGKFWDMQRATVIDVVANTMRRIAMQYGISLETQTLEADATNIVDLDYKLAISYSSDAVIRSSFERSYNPMNVSELQSSYPFINWQRFLSRSIRPITDSFVVNASTRIVVKEPVKLGKLSKDIRTGAINPQTLNNYILYKFAREHEWQAARTENMRWRTKR